MQERAEGIRALAVVAAVLALPAVGGWLAGAMPAAEECLPRRAAGPQTPFSPLAFALVAGSVAAALAPVLVWWRRAPSVSLAGGPRRPVPWWGWAGIAWTLVWWWLAWHRYPWFAGWQQHTFAPLWVGYVVVVNAWLWRRTGWSWVSHDRAGLARQALVSAGFWWLFEYLDCYVGNWYYVGIGGLSRWEYVAFATPAYATVLPAVVSTTGLIATVPRLRAVLTGHRPLPWSRRAVVPGAVAAGALALVAVGAAPRYAYPLLWLGPLGLMASLPAVGRALSGPARGDWHAIYCAAFAGLVCGLFWELWNVGSLAQWRYSVPWVERWHVFAMPLAGWAGYLPFGVECLAAAALAGVVLPDSGRRAGPVPGARPAPLDRL